MKKAVGAGRNVWVFERASVEISFKYRGALSQADTAIPDFKNTSQLPAILREHLAIEESAVKRPNETVRISAAAVAPVL